MQTWSEITHDVATNWPIYCSMPFIAALIGWFTKVVAIRMMFRPHTFKGIGPLGWQGIIPKRAPQMVDVLCETLTGRLISSAEIVDRVDPQELASRLERPLRAEVAEIIPTVAAEYQPAIWNLLPGTAKDLVVQRAQTAAVRAIPDLVIAIRENIEDIFDLREMVTKEFLSDPDILERMFLDVGRREFAFIRRSGLVFGFLIGLLQAICWALFHNPLIMPIFGLFTGWFTDWAALRLIFNPKEPKRYLGVVTWQGLFLKHRIPVSEEYGVLIATRVLTAERVVRGLLTGSLKGKVVDVFAPVIERAARTELTDVDDVLRRTEIGGLSVGTLDQIGVGGVSLGSLFGAITGAVSQPAQALGGVGLDAAQIGPMSRAAAAELVDRLPAVMTVTHDYLDDALRIKETMSEKMVAMTPEEFEGVLRPAFQADERTLILVGAILGFLVGELQVLMVEHFTH